MRNKEDVRIDIDGYVGTADVYLSARDAPNDPTDTNIVLRAAPGQNRAVILSIDDRAYYGYRTGIYFLCFYAQTPFSALLSANEAAMNDRFDYIDGQVLTRNMAPNSYSYGRYTNSAFSRTGTISVYAEYLEVADLPAGQEPPAIFYKICAEQNATRCALTDAEAAGQGMTAVGRVLDASTKVTTLGSFAHEPSACPYPASKTYICTYLISVVSRDSAYNTIGIRVSAEFDDPGDVLLTREYINIVEYGEFITYEINPTTNAAL